MYLHSIKQKYENLDNDSLLRLTNDLNGLNQDVIPPLLSELKKRKLDNGIEKINNYLNPSFEEINIDFNELKLEVLDRIKGGEGIESIKQDLKERLGESYYEFLTNEIDNAEDLSDDDFIYAASTLIAMDKQQASGGEIKETLKNNGINASKVDKLIDISKHNSDFIELELKKRLSKRTIYDLILGPIILCLGLVITIGTWGGNSTIIAFGAIITGGIKLIRGLANLSVFNKS